MERGAAAGHLDDLAVINLVPLMERTRGRPEIAIGLIDGPVAKEHTALTGENIREVPSKNSAVCSSTASNSCVHGTFVAGMLHGRRGSAAPSICPDCTLFVRPIFTETNVDRPGFGMNASPEELGEAVIDCLQSGVQIINLSVGLTQATSQGNRALEQALNLCAQRGVIVVAAAGNQGTVRSSVITRHPWVIPVVALGRDGRPTVFSNLGRSIGTQGIGAPGENVTSLRASGGFMTLSGTSVAAPFVTGALALLWSEFPGATGAQVKVAARRASTPGRTSILPAVLNALAAQRLMAAGVYTA
jgi:subtilisin family serine protease